MASFLEEPEVRTGGLHMICGGGGGGGGWGGGGVGGGWVAGWLAVRVCVCACVWVGGWVRACGWVRVGVCVCARVRACACVCVCRYARADGIICFYRYARADWMMQHRGPRSLRYVDVAFRDDGRCNYLSNKALDSGTARHSHDSRAFDLSRIPRDLPGSQVEIRSDTHALLHTGAAVVEAPKP
jgi:hypothetical protein